MTTVLAGPPYRYCPLTNKVFGHNDRIGGDVVICDIRGWGYLTGKGHGALGLSESEGRRLQEATGEHIARLLNEFSKETPDVS